MLNPQIPLYESSSSLSVLCVQLSMFFIINQQKKMSSFEALGAGRK
jgi:hypothetical protein